MEITNQIIKAQKIDNINWEFTVEYTANFAQHEMNIPFLDAIKIWEWDDSDHEALTEYGDHQEFTPQSTSVFRQKRILVDSGTLDTELGSEEIRAQIWLGNIPVPPGNRIEAFTHRIDIAP